MHIDWFTVAAQAINFLVLMWLLKRFLYKPILDAIAAREKHIADQLAEAKKKEAKAQKEQDDFKHKNEVFNEQEVKLLNDVKTEAEVVRANLLKDAEDEAEVLRTKKKAALQNEIDDLRDDFLRQTKAQVFVTASKVLGDLADTTIQERMIVVFITNLQDLSKKDKAALSSDTAVITSAFELSHTQQKTLKDEVKVKHIKFKVVPELVSGIELSVNGHKLAWSIGDYLGTLEQEASHAA